MRHLAQQISLLRADAPTPRELRRRSIVQALVIFPCPLVQLAWMYPLTEHRYGLMTLSGCRWLPADAWPFTVFFIIMHPLYALGALYYAIVVWYRYRQIAATATAVLATSNSAASNRARRARRRLYFMTLSILAPYFPVCTLFAAHNMLNYGSFAPLDVPALRAGRVDNVPWNTIFLAPTSSMDFGSLVDRYIAIITAFPVFLFFGLTKDAINTYRRAALVLGLGCLFPCLREEYDPDRRYFPTHGGPSASSHILATSETTQSAHAPAHTPASSPLASVLRSAFHRKGAPYPVRTETQTETDASPVAPAAGNAVPCTYLPQIPIGVVETRVWSTEDDASHARDWVAAKPGA
ncbi:unnamed protein product [Parascedosporium putredinis]|uniref:Uncharacterized protein n=1 Tax=Parascedosporium putredinis TaxID=1442378 RepID=A0A9P1M8C0_9PEZI|nr:unnamed protein product [Parascedosporium putredinis]CAI7988623.1 unnamed protein product [Parascedosporium putredinis]